MHLEHIKQKKQKQSNKYLQAKNNGSMQLQNTTFFQANIHTHTIINMTTRDGTEDTRLEAKAKDTKKIRGQGQGQTLSRPRPRTKDTDASVLQKKKVFKNFFQARKVFKNYFSGDLYLRKPKKKFVADFLQGFWRFPTKFLRFKNSAVLEPRTGQFSRT